MKKKKKTHPTRRKGKLTLNPSVKTRCLLELWGGKGQSGVLVAAEGLELEGERWRRGRQKEVSVRATATAKEEEEEEARKNSRSKAPFSFLVYPLDVRPHLLEQSRGIGGLGVGAALEVSLLVEEREKERVGAWR